MTDQIIIQEAARLVADGISVTFPVKGRSMIPFIIGGKESVILQRPDNLKVGHVILAEVGPDSCMQQHVLARATHVVDPQGRRRPLESRGQMFKARIWYWIRPFRRIILAVLRRTIRKYKI